MADGMTLNSRQFRRYHLIADSVITVTDSFLPQFYPRSKPQAYATIAVSRLYRLLAMYATKICSAGRPECPTDPPSLDATQGYSIES
jgi:hypothetical protein